MANCAKSGCSQTLSDESKVFICSGFCKGSFHSSCAGINRNIESVLNSCKNLKWYCTPCLKLSDDLNSIHDEIRLSRKQNEKQLDSVKSLLIDELYFQADIIKSAKNEILNKNEVLKTSYADVLMNNKDKKCEKEAVVIVKPKNKKQGNDKTKSDLKNMINPNDTPINGLINAKDSGVILKCKKKEDVNKIKNLVESKQSENYAAEIPALKNPRLKIVGLTEKPSNNEEILKTLKNQNEEFFDDSSVIKVVTVLKIKNTKGREYFNLIIEVNPKTYRKIMSIEDVKINFDFYRCKVFDALYVRRCHKCCSLDGHMAKDCEKMMVCYKCSGNHKSADCTSEVLKCINCDSANRRFNLKLDTSHNALERECPAFQRELKRRGKSIEYFE
jgi:hypothetical protein